jgi:hypothetical protein
MEGGDNYVRGFLIGVLLLEKSFYYLSIIWHLLSPLSLWGFGLILVIDDLSPYLQ